MRYQIKNITGDPTNVDPQLREGKTLYATSGQLQQLLPIAPQITAFISAKAYTELSAVCPQYFSVLDADGSEDLAAPFRRAYTCSATWQIADLGRYSSKIVITNTNTSNTIKVSFSGGTGLIGGGGTPPASMQSDVLKSETITFDCVMEPIRYVYYLGSGTGEVIYILAN
jgi:hypothetical protein